MKLSLRAIAIALASILAACSSGGTLPVSTHGTWTTAPMTFRVIVPAPSASPAAAARKPMYVSAATHSVAFALTSWNGAAQSPAPTTVVSLVPGTNCSGSPLVCTVTSSEPIGSDSFTVSTFSTANGSGTPLSINSVNYSIASGSNAISVTLNGVVNSLAFSPASVSCPDAATACTTSAALEALDASGDVIIGSGSYVDASNNTDTISYSCQTGLTAETSTGGTATTPFSSPATNNLAQVVYTANATTAGSSLTCTASDTLGHTATYTDSIAATGSVNWTIQ